ncbi:site-specific integrase [Zunongwangia pacifica]|uniref:Site-specific integrase n=1 Tax=Zunongwangia pacifica TaxID=2911062 RepID=A0A9X1ZR64_9FLAO|nr:site-specific integrase [Zunongwangia pacifica]MCL6216883.1 site-specific integrase [Zunongwangia pacifica]
MEQTKRSTFKLLFYLKKNEPKKNGTVAIMGRITIDGKAASFSTKLEITPSNWDLKHGRVPGKSKQALSTNTKLDNIRLRIDKHYEELLKYDGFVTPQKLKLSFLGVGIMEDAILKVFQAHNDDFAKMVAKRERSQSTHNKYKIVYNHLAEFIKLRYLREDMAFKELTSDFIREFDFYLRVDKECTHNTVWVYTMPVLRIVELAIKKGMIRNNPFEDYEITMKEADRGFLLKGDVEKIMLCQLPKKRYELVRDLFVFSCFTGLSYADIKKLKRNNIQNFFDGHQWVISRRKKTDVSSNVRLLEIPKKIIEKYFGTTRNEFVFPVPSNATCNNHITRIMAIAEITAEQKVTFHTARHTFATMVLTAGASLESVQKMMGHTNITTTQIYAKILNEKVGMDMDIVARNLKAMEVSFSAMEEKIAV